MTPGYLLLWQDAVEQTGDAGLELIFIGIRRDQLEGLFLGQCLDSTDASPGNDAATVDGWGRPAAASVQCLLPRRERFALPPPRIARWCAGRGNPIPLP